MKLNIKGFISIYIMQKVNKLNLKIINNNNELGNSRLEFNLSGSNMNYVIANTIRRTIFNDIPIYVFNEFKFDKNTSIFHNNYLKLRLRNMPIWSIENTIDYLDISKNKKQIDYEVEDFQYENTEAGDDVELEEDKTLNSSTLKQLTMYVNAKNKSNDILTVTTNDAKFYYDEKQIPSPYKKGIPIVKLQPNQEIAFSAISKIGMEQDDAMYSAVCVNYFKQNNDNDFTFIVESRGQITEKRIFQVALINIERRLKNFLKLIKDDMKINETKEQGIIIVNNEDHTLGNLISRGLQTHEKVSFAGYNLPHPLAKKVHFHYKLKSGNIIKVLEDVLDYYLELFKAIEKQIDTI
jgi:DNA-directed RNA polymerase subunit L